MDISSPVIGTDGTLYVGSDRMFYALNPNGSLRKVYRPWSGSWSGYYVEFISSPTIGADGTFYNGSYYEGICALDPNGNLKWSYQFEGSYPYGVGIYPYGVYSSPAIGIDGTIYVNGDWSTNAAIYALDPNGNLKWSYQSERSYPYGYRIYSSPAIGADGTVYFGSDDHKVYALDPNGNLKWSYQTGGGVCSSPAIGADGTVYFGSDDGKLYAFGSVKSINQSIQHKRQEYSIFGLRGIFYNLTDLDWPGSISSGFTYLDWPRDTGFGWGYSGWPWDTGFSWGYSGWPWDTGFGWGYSGWPWDTGFGWGYSGWPGGWF